MKSNKLIKMSWQTRIDVVLVDTAGRMQDNEPLMRSLAKLIKVNSPDLVLFVGEALVGNDAIDQLTMFNQSLAEFSQVKTSSGPQRCFLVKRGWEGKRGIAHLLGTI